MTTQKIVIRDERKADVAVITEVTVAAFETMEISSQTEQFIIEALRAAKALTVSLVAEMDGRVIGHIVFSPVTISDGTPNCSPGRCQFVQVVLSVPGPEGNGKRC